MQSIKITTKNVAVRFKSHHAAHETQSVLNGFSQEHINGGAVVSLRNASVAWRAGKYKCHSSKQSTARLQPLQVFKLIEGCATTESVLFHGYFPHLISGPGIQLYSARVRQRLLSDILRLC